MTKTSLESDSVMDAPHQAQDDSREFEMMIAIINTSLRVLNSRLILLFSLLGAIGIWLLAAFQPDPLRLWSALGYSLSVLIPTILFNSKKG